MNIIVVCVDLIEKIRILKVFVLLDKLKMFDIPENHVVIGTCFIYFPHHDQVNIFRV